MTRLGVVFVAVATLLWPLGAQAQFTQKLCKPTSRTLLIQTAAGNVFPSAGIAEPVNAGQFTLICVRATQNGPTAIWREDFGCGGIEGATALVSWRLGGRIQVSCLPPQGTTLNEETN